MNCKIFKIIVFYFINFSLLLNVYAYTHNLYIIHIIYIYVMYVHYIRQILHYYDHYNNKQCDFLKDIHSLFIE